MADDNEQKAPLRSRTGTLLWPAPAEQAEGDAPAPEEQSAQGGEPDPSAAPLRLMIGSLLNHIYKIERQIGRGGMAEVYEGVSVLTDERVAIKVILPHLAEDPLMEAMFLREARTLIRLSHPALVQYRLAARDPILDILYLVTEFVDGPGLDELMDGQPASLADTIGLMRRLAEGLGAAHRLGAIHRDLSPDNILLRNRRLEDATIIDFGIAKDLMSTSPTILGTGFAGKLKYVAPEQLGDFERSVGPWTDIYSLGLIMLAFSTGQDISMGKSMIEAVDRRRAGVDTSIAPEPLRALFAGMLQADPTQRLRSTDDVLRILNGVREASPITPAAEKDEAVWPPLEAPATAPPPPVAEVTAPPAAEPVAPTPEPSPAWTAAPAAVEETVFMRPSAAAPAPASSPPAVEDSLGGLTEEDMWRRLRARQTIPPGPVGTTVDAAPQDVDAAHPSEPADARRGGFPLIGWVIIIVGLIGAIGSGALWAAENLKLFGPKAAPALSATPPVMAPAPPQPVVTPPPAAVAPAPVAPVVPPPAPPAPAPVMSAAPAPSPEASPTPAAKRHHKAATSGTTTYKRVFTPDAGPAANAPAPPPAPSPAAPTPSATQSPAKKPGFLHRLFFGPGQSKPAEGSGESAPQN